MYTNAPPVTKGTNSLPSLSSLLSFIFYLYSCILSLLYSSLSPTFSLHSPLSPFTQTILSLLLSHTNSLLSAEKQYSPKVASLGERISKLDFMESHMFTEYLMRKAGLSDEMTASYYGGMGGGGARGAAGASSSSSSSSSPSGGEAKAEEAPPPAVEKTSFTIKITGCFVLLFIIFFFVELLFSLSLSLSLSLCLPCPHSVHSH